MPTRPIALSGFMGAGKTTVGRLLAAALDVPFYDTDEQVADAAGRSVDSFFPDEVTEFRRREAETVAELLRSGPAVIALGGGAPVDERTRALLLEAAVLVHLHVAWSDLREQLPALLASRPLLRGRPLGEIQRLYRERLAIYRKAPIEVRVRPGGYAEAVEDVLRAVERLGPAAGPSS